MVGEHDDHPFMNTVVGEHDDHPFTITVNYGSVPPNVALITSYWLLK